MVELPDGRRIRGGSVRHPREGAQVPEFSVYLLGREPSSPVSEYRWVRWPDFWLPASTDEAVSVLRDAYERSGSTRVEINCGSGIGRTGTALAFIATLGGVAPDEAVTWIRARYHPRAVETPWQRRWLRSAASRR